MSSLRRSKKDDSTQNVKVCFLGDSTVGKTSVALRYVENRYDETISTTIGAAYSSKFVKFNEKLQIKFHFWDTAGQERFRSLSPLYYRNCDVAILVYDVTSTITFYNLKDWVDQLSQYGSHNMVIVIAGNKVDCKTHRELSSKTCKEYAESVGAVFIEVSAKTGYGINALFERVAKALPLGDTDSIHSHTSTVVINENKREKKHCVC